MRGLPRCGLVSRWLGFSYFGSDFPGGLRGGPRAPPDHQASTPHEFAPTAHARQDMPTQAAAALWRIAEIERQLAVSGASDVGGEFRLLGGEDADVLSPAREGHIPLLSIRAGAGGG